MIYDLKKYALYGIFIILIAINSKVQAEVKLAKIFSDHMMVQRNKPINVWGNASPNSKVKITLVDKSTEVTAGADGRWLGVLPALEKGENLELIVSEQNTITIKDIIVGDIWLCSGQSNMEFKLSTISGLASKDIFSAKFPKIRMFLVGGASTPYPQEEIIGGPWQVCTPTSASNITAVGFFFAREIHLKTQIPIGILESDWGDSPIEPWIAPEGFKKVSEIKDIAYNIERERKIWINSLPRILDDTEKWTVATRLAIISGGPIPVIPEIPGPPGYNKPYYYSNFYNGKIFPLIRFPIKGALWYQGESNEWKSEAYANCMRGLITGWREVWQIGDFPFYYVQLANFQKPNDLPAGGDGWAKIRSAQLDSLKILNTGMASALDIGEAGDIHPKDKLNVGLRLALWALHDHYGEKNLVVSGPLFKEIKIDGSSIQISFDHVGSGLMIGKKSTINDLNWRDPAVEDKEGKLQRFAIAGADKVWYWADAVIDGTTVKVSSPKVSAPVAVRYAYSQNPKGANLYNKEGLPASSFCTDDW